MTARLAAALVCLVLLLLAGGQAFAQSIYWTETNYPDPKGGKADPDGANPQSTALTPATLPEGIGLDLLNDKVYWVESGFLNARVLSAETDFSGITEIVTGGSVYRGLALDVPGNHIYWTSSNLIAGSKIHRAALDGSGETVLVDFGPGNNNPRGIALDLGAGKMYWADFDQNHIARADLGGSTVESVVPLSAGSGPWGVALDVDGGTLFWTEYNTGRVMRSDLEGAGATAVVTGLDNPTYLTLDTDGGKLFWIEAGASGQRIQSAGTDGANVTDLGVSIQTYGGIVFDPTIPTQIRLMLFVANEVEEGIELQWQFGDQAQFSNVWVERSVMTYESWTRLDADILHEGERYRLVDVAAEPGHSYRYRLVAEETGGETAIFGPVIATLEPVITEFALTPVQPNPATGNARINFTVPRSSQITLSVIDVQGRVVATLIDEVKTPGSYEVVWDGRTSQGRASPGTYFVRFKTPERQLVERVVFLP